MKIRKRKIKGKTHYTAAVETSSQFGASPSVVAYTFLADKVDAFTGPCIGVNFSAIEGQNFSMVSAELTIERAEAFAKELLRAVAEMRAAIDRSEGGK